MISGPYLEQPAFRPHSPAELMVDRQIHRAGVAAGVVGAAGLAVAAAGSGSAALLISCLAYGAGLLAMLLCSAVYNQAQESPRRELFRRLDHAAIFVMIAGTYTPFTINRLPPAWGLTMTLIVWAAALSGALLKLARPGFLERISVVPYLAVGWIGVIALRPLFLVLDSETLALLAIGGGLYTLGTVFHLWHRLPYQNSVWHGFVMLAAGCHYVAIYHAVIGTAS